MRPQASETDRQLTKRERLLTVVGTNGQRSQPCPRVEVHPARQQSKMSAYAQSRVIHVQLTDSVDGAHCSLYTDDEIGKEICPPEIRVQKSLRRPVEHRGGNPPLMRPPLAVRPSRKPRLSDGFRQAAHVTKELKLANSLWTVALDVVPDYRAY